MTTDRQHIVTAEAMILSAEKRTIVTDTLKGLLDEIKRLRKEVIRLGGWETVNPPNSDTPETRADSDVNPEGPQNPSNN